MKTDIRSIYIKRMLVILLCTVNTPLLSQETSYGREELILAAKELMESAGYCALITLDDEGRARVRVMDPFAPDDDLTVWFGTNSESRKVAQIKADPRVTLYYFDSDASGYVMIHGIATMVDDDVEIEKHWKESWEDFYPNKSRYTLIKVIPDWMEIVSISRGIIGDSITWKPPVVQLNNKN